MFSQSSVFLAWRASRRARALCSESAGRPAGAGALPGQLSRYFAFVAPFWLQRQTFRSFREARVRFGRFSASLQETIAGMEVVQLFGCEERRPTILQLSPPAHDRRHARQLSQLLGELERLAPREDDQAQRAAVRPHVGTHRLRDRVE